MAISVIICCYNSCNRLPETLAHIAGQKVNVNWELVLVDNASTDGTAQLAQQLWQRSGSAIPIKIVHEARPGLSFAREAGLRNAAYNTIVFCDDDNWLSPEYLQTAYAIINNDEKIGICGGIAEAVFDKGAEPAWFDRYKLVFGCGSQAKYEGELGIDQLSLYGAGMIVRREIYDELFKMNYSFNLTGRKGDKIIAGEDFELCILARAIGYKLYYSERLNFKHYMPVQRMQWKYLLKIVHGSALSSAVAFVYSDTLRYKLTGKSKYKISWLKDVLRAINSARLVRLSSIRDLQVLWARLSGGLYSIFMNIGNYKRYKMQIDEVYDRYHHKD